MTLKELNHLSKAEELCEEFKKAHGQGRRQFHNSIMKIVDECSRAVAKKYSVRVPKYEILLCDTQTFDDLLSREPNYGKKPTAFIDRLKGIIAINLDALLVNYWGTFTVNLVMNVIEEILHAAFPLAKEPTIKKMTHEITEEYLQYELPGEYKKASLENASSPDY